MSYFLEHAERELLAAGYDPDQSKEGPNKRIRANILELIEVFAKQGHSGGSASYCIDAFYKLANIEPLVPLTGEDDEWDDAPSGELRQNIRYPRVLKEPGGRVFDIHGKVFRRPDGSQYTSHDSRVDVTFPYTPKIEYVDVPDSPPQ